MSVVLFCSVQWKVQGGSPEGTLAWVRQKGCFASGADDKVVLASAGREASGYHDVQPSQTPSSVGWRYLNHASVCVFSRRFKAGAPKARR